MAATGQGLVPMQNQMPVSSIMHHQVGVVPNQQNPQIQAPQPQQGQETDPIAKFKNLLPRLKESLVNLFKTGGHLFYQNASQDETGAQMDNVTGRFEKCLEEFYALCDQVEIYLKLAQEVIQQDKDSNRNTPNLILPQKNDASQPEGQLYSQYLSTVRAQISCAKDIRDLLHDCLKSFPEHSHP